MKDLRDQTVLIVNDDGIHAKGVRLLEDIVRRYTDNVWVVAPDEERSGASNSISMHVPVRARKIDERHFAVKGTPTDCALMAVYEIMPERPTLLLSGINAGANLAEDVLYSGTIAAAMEGALLGVPSIAFSQIFTPRQRIPWDTAQTYAPQILEALIAQDWEPGCFISVNFPDAPASDVIGVKTTTQGRRLPGSFKPSMREDERNVPYYWIKLDYDIGNLVPGTDLHAVHEKAVSVCPITLDMTAHEFYNRLSPVFA